MAKKSEPKSDSVPATSPPTAAAKRPIEAMWLPIDRIVPNAWNPNKQSDSVYELLKDEIAENGNLAPIQVVPLEDGTYRIIGGEHRWRASKELGAEEIMCVVLKDKKWEEQDLCFPAGTRIETPRGGRVIEEIVPGDTVFAADGTESEVLGVLARDYSGSMTAIVAEGSVEPLIATSNHSVFVMERDRDWKWTLNSKPIGEVEPGDFVAVPVLALTNFSVIPGNKPDTSAPYQSAALFEKMDGPQGACRVLGCDRDNVYAHGLCRRCYARNYYRTKLSKTEIFPEIGNGQLLLSGGKAPCVVSGCAFPVKYGGLCSKHKAAERRLGPDWEDKYRARSEGVPDMPITPDNAWAIGFLIAEGHCAHAAVSVAQVGFPERLDRIETFWKALGVNTARYDHGTHSEVYAFGIKVSEWLASVIGHRTHFKRIPQELLRHPDAEVREALLDGIAQGDGSNARSPITTTSEELAYQLRWLLGSLGYTFGVKREERQSTVWGVSWTVNRDADRIESRRRCHDGYIARRVRSVDHWETRQTVYNLETTPQHTYIANGISVRNCKFVTVRLNVIQGKLDPDKFLDLHKEMVSKYGAESIQRMMGFADAKAFQRVLGWVKKGLKKSLPAEMAQDVEEASKEVKTMADIGNVIQDLYNKYGDTLNSSFMVFTFGKQTHLYIAMDAKTRRIMDRVTSYCREAAKDIIEFLAPDLESADKRALKGLADLKATPTEDDEVEKAEW